MARHLAQTNLGQRELDIMQSLWRLTDGTVADVHAELRSRGIEVAYTTVQTMLNRMERKGLVARELSDRAHRYRAVLRERMAIGGAIRSISGRFFRGSREALAIHLIETNLTSEQLDRLQRALDRRRRGNRS